MPRLKSIQASFVAGELDPLLIGRTDIKQYYQGCALARNVTLLPQGGWTRRAGLERIDDLGTIIASGLVSESRCVDFEFSTTQTYKLIFTDFRINVYLAKALVATVTTVYAHADLAKITWIQSLDNLFLFHEDYPTQQLTRGAAHTIWNIAPAAWVNIPTYRFTPSDQAGTGTLTPSATIGTIDATSSAAEFVAGDVGQYISGNGGYGRIVSFTSTTVVKVAVITPFYDTTAIPIGEWDIEKGWEDAWSVTRGYPRCGTFYQGRFYIGGSKELPQSLWGSKSNLFFDFDLGTNLDDEGIAVTLDTDEVSAINQLYSGRTLQLFTSGGEFFVPNDINQVITPSNISIRRSTRHGSKEGIPVVNIDGETAFINRSGGALRGFVYQEIEQSYVSASKSLLASHLIRVPVGMAFKKATSTEEADYLYIVNSDGTMAVLNTLRDQEINGWALLEIDGSIKDVAVELDTVFLTTERTINGVTARHIEYFDDKHALDSSVYIDTGLPTDTFTGLDHLDGETVEVIADGNRLTPVLVTAGSATIERDATTYVEFGRNYKQTGDTSGDGYKVKTMPIDAQLPDGTMIGKKKRLVEVTVQLTDTQSLKINNQRVSFRQLGSDLLDAPATPYTGYKVVEGILGYSDAISIEFGDDVPSPATVNAVAYKVAV